MSLRFAPLAALVLALAGCGQAQKAGGGEGPGEMKQVRMAVRGSEDDPAMAKRWDGYRKRLSAATGLPVKLYESSDYNGTIQAISASTGKTEWKFEQRAGMLSLISTGSGLLFGGDANGHFRAYDQRTGEILWDINLGAPVNGYPATFSVGGKQYVAVSTGGSGLAFGLGRLTPELKPGSGNQLFVFALP